MTDTDLQRNNGVVSVPLVAKYACSPRLPAMPAVPVVPPRARELHPGLGSDRIHNIRRRTGNSLYPDCVLDVPPYKIGILGVTNNTTAADNTTAAGNTT